MPKLALNAYTLRDTSVGSYDYKYIPAIVLDMCRPLINDYLLHSCYCEENTMTRNNLQKEEVILAYSSREVRVHHERGASRSRHSGKNRE